MDRENGTRVIGTYGGRYSYYMSMVTSSTGYSRGRVAWRINANGICHRGYFGIVTNPNCASEGPKDSYFSQKTVGTSYFYRADTGQICKKVNRGNSMFSNNSQGAEEIAKKGKAESGDIITILLDMEGGS